MIQSKRIVEALKHALKARGCPTRKSESAMAGAIPR